MDDIRERNGGITEDDRRHTRPNVLRSLQHLRTHVGASVQLLASELYSTTTRFVFELIQNAEDNSYTDALARQEAPFLQFALHLDRILIDSNEDGFDEDNVRAICAIRQSTKQPGVGYIGQKGIGFKSVFSIAYKVNIQSGPFCFCFEHHRGETGMGMITPVNQDHQILPDNVRTRITLFLAEPDKFRDRLSDLTEIPDTLILFLSKLAKISVLVKPNEGASSSMSYERHGNMPGSSLKLIQLSNDDEKESLYHVQSRTVYGLPADEARGDQRRTEVILAFPIDASSKPVIRPQYVYSFLPVREASLNVRGLGLPVPSMDEY